MGKNNAGKQQTFHYILWTTTPSHCSAWAILCVAYCSRNTIAKGWVQANESVIAVQECTYAYKHRDTTFPVIDVNLEYAHPLISAHIIFSVTDMKNTSEMGKKKDSLLKSSYLSLQTTGITTACDFEN